MMIIIWYAVKVIIILHGIWRNYVQVLKRKHFFSPQHLQ